MFKKTGIALAVLSLPALCSVAYAQESKAPEKSNELEKVVVTSQKRREDVRQVPLSVTAIKGDVMQANQIVDFTDLSRNIPNVSFSSQGGSGLSTIEIRGISSQAGSATVGVYMDDVSLTTRNLYSQGTAEPRFFDIERVEVLRGPQGTLYGAGAMGGTLRFISKEPSLKTFSTDIRAEVSQTDQGGLNSQAQAVINVPLSPNAVGLRIGFQTGHDSGYVDQIDANNLRVINKNINSSDWNVLKLAVKADLGGGWVITPALFAQKVKTADIDASYLTVGDYQPTPNAGKPLPRFQSSKIVREPGEDTLLVPSLTATGDLGFADFTGVASAYSRQFNRTQDGTYINSNYIGSLVADPDLGALVAYLPSQVNLKNEIQQASLELRLASKTGDARTSPISWVTGVFFSQTKTDVADDEPVLGLNAAFQSRGLNIYDPNNWLPDSGPYNGAFRNDSCYYSARHYDAKQSSVFGEVTYHFSPTLRGIAGLRYLKSTEDFRREGDLFFANGPSAVYIAGSATKATPRLALSWDAAPTTTVFANMAEGFRLGGANRPIPLLDGVKADLATLGLSEAPKTFKPDSLWSYEVGTKSRLWDNRVSVNLSAFYIDWKSIQQNVYLPTNGFDFETNVGRANSMGLEAEVRARVSPELTLQMGAGFTRAEFAEDVPGLGLNDQGQPNVRKGDSIVGVPEYNVRLGGEYFFSLTDAIDSVVRINAQWTGASKGALIPSNPDYQRPAYATIDASWGFTIGRWDLALNVKNLTNENTVLQKPNIQSVNQGYTLRPRTVGLTASTSF